MKSIMQALMPAHNSVREIVALQLAEDFAGEQFAPKVVAPDPVFELQGQSQLVDIAQIDRELALTLKRLINQLQEADFAEASGTGDELCHRIRTHYLASLSDRMGTVKYQ